MSAFTRTQWSWAFFPLAIKGRPCYNRHGKQKCGSPRVSYHPRACAGEVTTYTTASRPHRMGSLYDNPALHARAGFLWCFRTCVHESFASYAVWDDSARRFCFSPGSWGRLSRSGGASRRAAAVEAYLPGSLERRCWIWQDIRSALRCIRTRREKR